MKFKFVKRVIASALTMAMVASTMVITSACSSGPKELITLDVLSTRANFEGVQSGWMAQVLADKFGVRFNIIQGDEDTLSIKMEEGNLGDLIVWGVGGDTYLQACENGLLLDWEANGMLDKYAPYIKEHCASALENAKTFNPAGKIYSISGGVAASADGIDAFFYNWDIRWDLYEKIGKPAVKDMDDLYDVFVAMKDAYPTNDSGLETYAMSLWPDWDGQMVMYVKCLAQAFYGLEGDYVSGLYDNDDGAFHDVLEENGPYMNMVKFLNKLYRAGLLDPDSMTQKYDDAVGKVRNDRVFFSIFNYAGSTAYNTAEHLADGKGMYSLLPSDAQNIVYGLSVNGIQSQSFSVGAKSQYPDKVLEILNWMYSPEGRLTTEYGPEGLCWYYSDDAGNVVKASDAAGYNGTLKTNFTQIGAALHDTTSLAYDGVEGAELPAEYSAYAGLVFKEGTNEMNNITWNGNTVNPDTNERFNCDYWESVATSKATSEVEADWRAWAKEQTNFDVFDADSYLAHSKYDIFLQEHIVADNKVSEFKTLEKQINTATTEGTWKAIYAGSEEEFDKAVEAMSTTIRSYGRTDGGSGTGYDQLVEWATEQCKIRYDIEQEFIKAHPDAFK